MARCLCIKKTDGRQCTRKASIKPSHKPKRCWQHQICLKKIKPQQEQVKELKPCKKLFIEPFIQNSNEIVVFDPNMGKNVIGTDKTTILSDVVGGLWKTNILSVENTSEQFSHLKSIEVMADGIKPDLCKWDYEGVFETNQGWVGIFDHKIINTTDLKSIIKSQDNINRYRYGIYVNIGLSGEYEVTVCRDARGKIVGIHIQFTK